MLERAIAETIKRFEPRILPDTLVVRAIDLGRRAAEGVDRYLMARR